MGLKAFWDRLRGKQRAAADERVQEYEHMSPEERRFVSESVDDRAAELESEVRLGGSDPGGPVDVED